MIASLNVCKISQRGEFRDQAVFASKGSQLHASGLVHVGCVDFSIG